MSGKFVLDPITSYLKGEKTPFKCASNFSERGVSGQPIGNKLTVEVLTDEVTHQVITTLGGVTEIPQTKKLGLRP